MGILNVREGLESRGFCGTSSTLQTDTRDPSGSNGNGIVKKIPLHIMGTWTSEIHRVAFNTQNKRVHRPELSTLNYGHPGGLGKYEAVERYSQPSAGIDKSMDSKGTTIWQAWRARKQFSHWLLQEAKCD